MIIARKTVKLKPLTCKSIDDQQVFGETKQVNKQSNKLFRNLRRDQPRWSQMQFSTKFRTPAITHCCPFLFNTKHFSRSMFAPPQMFRCLTQTRLGISPIQVQVSHSYTPRGLTHRNNSDNKEICIQ